MVFKSAKPEVFLLFTVIVALAFFAGSFFTVHTGAITSVKSVVTPAGNEMGYFEVPVGKVAKEFSESVSRQTASWGIYKARLVDGKPVVISYDPVYHTSYGSSSKIILYAGQYVVMAHGGVGSKVTVYYDLV